MDSERSRAPITRDHLERLAEIARLDRAERIQRRLRWRAYENRVLCVTLCQGAALHFVDQRNGVKDFDVYTFYAEHAASGPFPARWRLTADFGPSVFGRSTTGWLAAPVAAADSFRRTEARLTLSERPAREPKRAA